MRRRIWCELLPAEELGTPATLGVLERFRLEPLVALPPARETGAMAAALARLSRRGIRVGLWPLLSDGEGYWPSEHNAAAFCGRVERALAFAERAGARVATVAIDLEPPLGVTHALLAQSWPARAHTLGGALARSLRADQRASRDGAVRRLSQLAAELHARGVETLAAAMPTVAIDLATRTHIWDRALRTPTVAPGWSVLSPMMYTSMLAPALPGGTATARALLVAAGVAVRRRYGPERASLSLGVVGTGKLGDEPRYADPDALAADVAAARFAGIDDLALFSLEGVLQRGPPERWLRGYAAGGARLQRRFRVR